jgi:hypothetical protein
MVAERIEYLERRIHNRLTKYVKEVERISEGNLISVILYGDFTSESTVMEKTYLNFLIVLEEISVEFLVAYSRIRKRFRNIPIPLIVTPELIKTSLDIFPIEFLTLQESYIVLYGEDLLGDIQVRIEDLRYEIEQQVKRRLIKLREEFINSLETKADLERLLTASLISFIPLFKNILYLLRVKLPLEGTLFREFCRELGLDERPFFDIWAIRNGKKRYRKNELIKLFGDFANEIESLAIRLEDLGRSGRD